MSLKPSFASRLSGVALGLLAWSQLGGLVAAESALPSDPEGAPVIETETVAATLGIKTLPDGTRTKEWLPATDIRQGQVVYYTVRIRNPGTGPAHNVVVTKPVPANTRYVAESAAAPGAVVSFSIDGGKTFAPARELVAKEARGTPRPASPDAYTHIRWQLRYPLAPGATAYARFRAVFR
jgi:uncharacterized repeat protein (TIGR01451 family)